MTEDKSIHNWKEKNESELYPKRCPACGFAAFLDGGTRFCTNGECEHELELCSVDDLPKEAIKEHNDIIKEHERRMRKIWKRPATTQDEAS